MEIAELEHTNILYLDDDPSYLKMSQKTFQKHGITIGLTDSSKEAKSKAIKNVVDILICDLRLDDVNPYETGKDITQYIRKKNEKVYLAIFTAFKPDISKPELERLEAQNIGVYDKDDLEEFIMSLHDDYSQFKSTVHVLPRNSLPSEQKIIPKPLYDLVQKMKSRVLQHLQKVTVKNKEIPVTEDVRMPISKLKDEVENETEIGVAYMSDWFDTMSLIKDINANEHNKTTI